MLGRPRCKLDSSWWCRHTCVRCTAMAHESLQQLPGNVQNCVTHVMWGCNLYLGTCHASILCLWADHKNLMLRQIYCHFIITYAVCVCMGKRSSVSTLCFSVADLYLLCLSRFLLFRNCWLLSSLSLGARQRRSGINKTNCKLVCMSQTSTCPCASKQYMQHVV